MMKSKATLFIYRILATACFWKELTVSNSLNIGFWNSYGNCLDRTPCGALLEFVGKLWPFDYHDAICRKALPPTGQTNSTRVVQQIVMFLRHWWLFAMSFVVSGFLFSEFVITVFYSPDLACKPQLGGNNPDSDRGHTPVTLWIWVCANTCVPHTFIRVFSTASNHK